MSDASFMPELTVIVVVLGDDPRLEACLESLAAEVRTQLELVLVENGAAGPPPELPILPRLRIRRPENPGFAAAVEEALDRSRGRFVLTLNPDARVLPGSLASALAAMADDPRIGSVAFRLMRPEGDVLDSAGIRLGFLRRPRDRGMGRRPRRRHLQARDVDAACMACALFRRTALEGARDGAGEIVDRRYFAYKEDVDVGWRLRRAGWRIRYVPEAVAIHERGWREGGRRRIPQAIRILSLRNRWLTILKNESPWSLLLRTAVYIPFELLVAGYLLVREPRTLRAYPAVLAEIGETRRRRRLDVAGAPPPGPA